jgi:hypothetical protein
LVWRAILARRVPLATVLLLTSVAVAAAVAGPWYVLGAAESSADATVASAPAELRTLSVTRPLPLSGPPGDALSSFRASVERALPMPGLVPVLGLLQGGQVTPPSGAVTPVPVGYRDGVCAHLVVTGACTRSGGEALLSRHRADLLGARVGGLVKVAAQVSNPPIALRVAGVYDLADPSSGYWSGTPFAVDDPIFVPLATFGHDGLDRPKAVYDAEVPAATIRSTPDLGARLTRADYALSTAGLALSTRVPGLAGTVADDRRTIGVGVLVGAVELLALSWFALYLSGRYTARDRRADVAVLKLHGARRSRVIRVLVGQALAPTLAGLVLGGAIGALLAGTFAGSVPDRLGWRLSLAGAGLAVLGALAALTLADLGTLRTDVAELLRQVPPRRRRGRSQGYGRQGSGRQGHGRRSARSGAVAELSVLAVAAAAVYQARVQASSGYQVPGLPELAPALVAVAVAVLAGRLLGYLAARTGSQALDAGRLRLALGALQVSRRPGTERVFALVAVSVAVLATAANGWAVASAARSARVVVDLGADRVLAVRADSATALLSAVRAADPGGREAMAVVVNSRGVVGTSVLAVDSTRLARVARWRPEYPPVDRVVSALRSRAPQPVRFTGATLTLDATGAPDTFVIARLENQRSGAVVQALFGPLSQSRQAYRADVVGCADPPGCRLVSVGLAGAPGPGGQPTEVTPGESATITTIGTVAGADLLGDPRRWRPAVAGIGLGLVIAPAGGRLGLTADTAAQHGLRPDFQAYLVDGPVPLPAVFAGDPPADWALGQAYARLFGADAVPVRVTATARVLPVVGRQGVLVDLDSARMLAGGTGSSDVQQVWLARSAGQGVVDRLRANGIRIVGDDSAARYRSRLDVQGPAAVARFTLAAAVIGLLLAAGTVAVVGAVERGPRARELAALRRQGLPASDARAVSYLGYAVTAGAALLTGLASGLLANADRPVFTDSWSVLPSRPVPLALLATAAGAAGVLGFVVWLAGRRSTR